jgi:hypothetical protein
LLFTQDRYPCDDNETFNFVCIHPADLSNASSDTYDKAANKDLLLEIFKDFEPTVLAMLEKADKHTLRVYPLFDMDPLSTFVTDKLALVGDVSGPTAITLTDGDIC